MKRIIIFVALLVAFFLLGCKHVENEFQDYNQPLANFLSTKTSQPLEGTVWMAQSTDEFRRMLLFKDGVVRLFYGLVEKGEIQRWSEYYDSPYMLSRNAHVIIVSLVYPIFGEKEFTESLTCVKIEDAFVITSDFETYDYIGEYSHTLDDRWTLVYTTIQPWGEE